MKKLKLLVATSLIYQFCLAQYPCANGISTHPDSATNPQQSNLNFVHSYFINDFNWYDYNGNGGFTTIPFENMSQFYTPF